MKNITVNKVLVPIVLIILIGIIAIFSTQDAGDNYSLGDNMDNFYVSDLLVEYMTCPVGIDVEIPRFSYRINSTKRGVMQVFYKIVVKKDSNDGITVWDSGKVESPERTNIEYNGENLLPSTRYYYTIESWDNYGNSNISDGTDYFETGLFNENNWNNAEFITYYVDQPDVSNITTYTVTMDFEIERNNAGIIFAMMDNANYYLWQFNTYNGKSAFRPHVKINGMWTQSTDNNGRPIEDIDTSDKIVITSGIEYTVKIEVIDKQVITYVKEKGDDIFILIDDFTFQETIGFGYPGFRSDTEGGLSEKFYIDNIVVTNSDSEIIIAEDFNSDIPYSKAEIVNGRLFVDGGGSEKLISLQNNNNIDSPSMFRKTFSLDNKLIVNARLYSTALGVYDVYINGDRVGTKNKSGEMFYDELKPGFTDFNETLFYSTYDITDMLSDGNNVIGAEVASGWWNGEITQRTAYGNKPNAFKAMIVVIYEDGTESIIVTDTSWLSSKSGSVLFADIYDGEIYDARITPISQWSIPSYDDSDWNATAISNDFTGTIKAYIGPKVHIVDAFTREAESITKYQGTIENGTHYGRINVVDTYQKTDTITLNAGETLLIDFGQNMVGWEKFTVLGERDTKITVEFAEMLNDSGGTDRGNDGPEGSIYNINFRHAQTLGIYYLSGDTDGETYSPRFTFYGFRYIEITTDKTVELSNIYGMVVTSIHNLDSTLETNNDSINKLFQNIQWGQIGNFLSIPTDCPQRDERLGWTGDILAFARAATYNSEVAAFLTKWMGDMRDSQFENGAFPNVAPSNNWITADGQGAWAEAGIVIPWTVYLMYNDKRIIQENYAAMEKYMDYLLTQGDDYYEYNGAGTHYGDWLSYEGNHGETRRFISVAFYAYAASLMSKMSEVLAQSDNSYAEKVTYYKQLFNNIKDEFNIRYVKSDGTLRQTAQTDYLLALKLNLLPDEKSRQHAINTLVLKIKENDNRLSTGFVGTAIINQTLSELGYTDVAYDLLLQEENPSWLYSVNLGGTTVWERWNSYTIEGGFHRDVSMNSFNHYAYGAVGEWMFRYMVGIDADENNPGFQHFILRPKLDMREISIDNKITRVNGSYSSMQGDIISGWELFPDGTLNYHAVVPAGTTATLYLPITNDKFKVTESGVNAKNANGVTFIGTADGVNIYELASGEYNFSASKKSMLATYIAIGAGSVLLITLGAFFINKKRKHIVKK